MDEDTNLQLEDYIDPTWPYQVISELLSLPTLFVIILLSVKHYRKGFNGSFQKLTYITILNDLFTFYIQVLIFRWPQSGVIGFYRSILHSPIPSVLTYFWQISTCHQHLLILLIAINRVHSVLAPIEHHCFWEDHLGKLVIFAFLLPQPICIFVASEGAFYEQVAKKTWFMHTEGMTGAAGKTLLYGTVTVSLFTGLCNAFSIINLLIWRKHHSARGDFRVNFGFHVYSILTFLMEMFYNLTELGIHFFTFGSSIHRVCIVASNVAIDILCLSSVWLWLCMSKDVRRLLRKEKQKSVVILTMTTRM